MTDKHLILHILGAVPVIVGVIAIGAAFIALLVGAILFIFLHKQPNMRLLFAVTILGTIILFTPAACYLLYLWAK